MITKCFLMIDILAKLNIPIRFYDFNIVNIITDYNLNINFYQYEDEQKIANFIFNDIMAEILTDEYYYQTSITDEKNINYSVIYHSLLTKLIVRLIKRLNPYLTLLLSDEYQKILQYSFNSKAISNIENKNFVETIGKVDDNEIDNNYNNKNIQTHTMETNSPIDQKTFEKFIAIKQEIADGVIGELFFHCYNPDDIPRFEKY